MLKKHFCNPPALKHLENDHDRVVTRLFIDAGAESLGASVKQVEKGMKKEVNHLVFMLHAMCKSWWIFGQRTPRSASEVTVEKQENDVKFTVTYFKIIIVYVRKDVEPYTVSYYEFHVPKKKTYFYQILFLKRGRDVADRLHTRRPASELSRVDGVSLDELKVVKSGFIHGP
ncbi:hypothetical protein EVAR_37077_1 [Eumeta japonica]|uniref:Uncharacterized protein n=1 Tax=Eumeta variegata TaxID=151549 RepID=A0A4C1WHJ5_EUMVA|nr:hypothetical protein EVAR_37077_1 [Eumeta japonica]